MGCTGPAAVPWLWRLGSYPRKGVPRKTEGANSLTGCQGSLGTAGEPGFNSQAMLLQYWQFVVVALV